MKTKLSIWGLVAVCVLAMIPTTHVSAQTSDALIDELVQKGVLSDQEGEDVRAKLIKDWAASPASKIYISSAIRNIKLYGDVRLRFESRSGDYNGGTSTVSGTGVNGSGGSETRDRFRYRLRVGIKGDLYDNGFFDIGFATNAGNQRSGNITFGDNGSNGPFGKGKSSLNVNKVMIGWHATDFLTLEAGQFDNPFYTTNLTWDPNITPAGFAELLDKKIGTDWNVFANAGQFVYSASPADNTGTTGIGNGISGKTVFQFEEQVGFKVKFSDTNFFKMAGGITTYSGTNNSGSAAATGAVANPANGAQPSNFAGPFLGGINDNGTISGNNFAVNNLAVLDFPMEFDFKALDMPMKLFGDVAYNLEADHRSSAAAAYVAANPTGNGNATKEYTNLNRNNGDQALAYQAGYQIGELKKKGDWQAKVYWDSVGYYALDPNLVDADIWDGRTNMQGFIIEGQYQFTDALSGRVEYANGSRVDDQLATPGTGQDLTLASINRYQLVQADVMWKF